MAYDDVLHDAAQAEKARIRAMTTPTDDELLEACDRVLASWLARDGNGEGDVTMIARELKSRLTSQSRDEVIEECATAAECWSDSNPNIVDSYWTGLTLANAIRALKGNQ